VAAYATQHSDANTLAGGDVASRAGSANERSAGSGHCQLGLSELLVDLDQGLRRRTTKIPVLSG